MGKQEKVSPDRQLDSLLEEATDGAGVPVLMRALGDLPVGIGVLRVADLVFVSANRLYESWYQPDRRPIVGKTLDQALVAAPQVAQVFKAAAADGEPVHFDNSEFRSLRPGWSSPGFTGRSLQTRIGGMAAMAAANSSSTLGLLA
jgi:hypothetical protein